MEEKMVAFYNANAVSFDKEQEEFGFIRKPEWEIALKALTRIARPNHTVLEIGAGTGRFSLEIAPLVRQVTAVDISQNMLVCLGQKMAAQGISNVKPLWADFMEASFDQKFDIIMGFSAIEYIRDKEALIAKISALLAPGGHLIITTTHQTFFRWWGRMGNYFRQGIFMEAYSRKEMLRLLMDNGLEAREIRDLCLKSMISKGILLFVHAQKRF